MKSTILSSVFTSARFKSSSLFLSATAAVVFLCVAAQPAYAHFPIVAAPPLTFAACNPDGSVTIHFTVVSWDPGSHQISGSLGPHDGENQTVEVLFGNTVVFTGSFVDPTDSFNNSEPAPAGSVAGDMVLVSAFVPANSPWGDGFGGGQSSTAFSDSQFVTIPACAPPATGNGRFTGGGKVITQNLADGQPVELTKGFEVECDKDPAHENLELNWEGNHFHMDTITFATCDLIGKLPNPPTATVNRIVGAGTGDFNGAEGYTVLFTLIDHGEPGVNDEAGFVVCQTADTTGCPAGSTIVLEVVVQPVTTGNIQAHVDQH